MLMKKLPKDASKIFTKTFSTVPMSQFILVPCDKGAKMKCWESFFMHVSQKQNVLIDERRVRDLNPLYEWHNMLHYITRYSIPASVYS
jgi:hypothetical protein